MLNYYRKKKVSIKYMLLFLLLITNAVLYTRTRATDSLLTLYKHSTGARKVKIIYDLIESDDIPYSLVDSLNRVAMNIFANDTTLDKGYAYYFKGRYYYDKKNADSSIYYLNKAVLLGKKTNKTVLSKSYILLAKSEMLINYNEKKGLSLLNKMYEFYNNNPDFAIYSNYYKGKGFYYSLIGNIDSAIIFYKKADSIYLAAGDMVNHSGMGQTISYLYFTKGDIDKSSSYLIKITDIDNNELGAGSKVYYNFNFLAHLKELNIDIEKQIELSKETIKLLDYLQDSVSAAYMRIPLGKIYLKNKQYDTAFHIFKEALKLSKQINNELDIAHSMSSLFNIYLKYKQYDTAVLYADSALTLFRKHKITALLKGIQLDLAGYYSSIGKYQTAELYFDSVNRFLKKHPQKSMQLKYEKLYAIQKAGQGNYKKAFELMKSYAFDIDSLRKSELENKLSKLYVLYKTKKKEKENIILKQKLIIERQQKIQHQKAGKNAINYLIITVILLVLIIALLITYRQNVKHKRKLNIEKISRIERENSLLEQEKTQASEKLKAHNELVKVMNNQLLYQALISSKLIDELKMLKDKVNHEAKIKIQTVLAEFKSFSASQNWINFEKNFTKIFPGVQEKIKNEMPDLSTGDFRVLCFLIMRLSNREISMITLQSNSSLRSATFRLRKKFNVETNEQLIEKIDQITGGKISNTTYSLKTANH